MKDASQNKKKETNTFQYNKINHSGSWLDFERILIAKSTNVKYGCNDHEVVLVVPGDYRRAENIASVPMQQLFETKLRNVLEHKYGYKLQRAHQFSHELGHGFIENQRQGADIFTSIHHKAPVILLVTRWQYSHHVASGLVHHRGPILVLANFDGTWPGLVGALNLSASLHSLGKTHSRLWSENFDDLFFFTKLEEWLKTGEIKHDLSYLKMVPIDTELIKTPAGKFGQQIGEQILEKKEIMGLFDMMCMGMINGLFPMKSLYNIGIPIEGLSQSQLLHEMEKIPQKLRQKCLQYYIDKGMTFYFGSDPSTELTRDQVLEQCAMMIAAARIAEHYHLTSIGIQYQLGLDGICAASDFAEGALGSTDRFPIPDEIGNIIRPGKPIPHINEVDMGSGIPQTMLFRLLDTLGLPSETTLHDIRWGAEYKDTFLWDFEISGNVPFEHIKGGIGGAYGYRQPKEIFSAGGSTISGQCKAGTFIWARAYYEGSNICMHIGTGRAYELPQEDFQKRLYATTRQWPLMNATLDGITRNDLMAGHQSNHITVAYIPEEYLKFVVQAFTAMALRMGITVFLAGEPDI